ncbi:MAG: hypothetical protein K1X53_17900 [Candidatus Sumerlaeaceae bacterium]|nr:hypothetical protein [Candidatus Sumerlaeaceae bacterium]
MNFTCNIGFFGRAIRLATGILLLASAAALYYLGLPVAGWVGHVFQLILAGTGLFTVFEGAVGWCAIRAMGRKTPF